MRMATGACPLCVPLLSESLQAAICRIHCITTIISPKSMALLPSRCCDLGITTRTTSCLQEEPHQQAGVHCSSSQVRAAVARPMHTLQDNDTCPLLPETPGHWVICMRQQGKLALDCTSALPLFMMPCQL